LAVLLAASAYALQRTRAQRGGRALGLAQAARMPGLTPLSIDLGRELERELALEGRAALEAALDGLRTRLFTELGFVLPAVRVALQPELAPRVYELALYEVPFASGEVTRAQSSAAAASAIVDTLGARARVHAHELLGLQETQSLLDALEKSAPALVRQLVPKPISLQLLTEVLRKLLRVGVSIRPLAQILEALAGAAAGGQADDPSALAERVRASLSRQLTHARSRVGVLVLHPVDPMIEDALRDAALVSGEAAGLALPPEQAREIVAAVRGARDAGSEPSLTLVTQPDVRRHLRKLLEVELPEVAVLSYPELAPDARIERRTPIRIGLRAGR
jgi:type III secretion protein V